MSMKMCSCIDVFTHVLFSHPCRCNGHYSHRGSFHHLLYSHYGSVLLWLRVKSPFLGSLRPLLTTLRRETAQAEWETRRGDTRGQGKRLLTLTLFFSFFDLCMKTSQFVCSKSGHFAAHRNTTLWQRDPRYFLPVLEDPSWFLCG